MANRGPLDVLFQLYGLNVKSVRHLRGGVKLLELFSLVAGNSPNENWSKLRDVLRSYFPQLDASLDVAKCEQCDHMELAVAASLSIGALIAQDFSKSSASPDQELTGRLKALCDYTGPEVGALKDFCEIVCTGERVAAGLRELVAGWLEAMGGGDRLSSLSASRSAELLSVSVCSSASSSTSPAVPMRCFQSPLSALRTPENHRRVRDKYSNEVIALRRELLVVQDRYEQLDAEMVAKLEAKEKEVRQLQGRLKMLREMVDQEQASKENRASVDNDSITQSRLKIVQKQLEQLKAYEQKFFDEKERADELDTKLLQAEKRIRECRVQLQVVEALVVERDEELARATDKIVELQSRLDDERVQRSFARQRDRSVDTLDSLSGGENIGEAVEAVVVEEQRSEIEQLSDKLKLLEQNLKAKEQDLAEALLSGNLKQEQIVSLEAEVASLKCQTREHIETIGQAAVQANELSAKLQESTDERDRLDSELAELRLIRARLEETIRDGDSRLKQASAEVDRARDHIREMDRVKALLEEQFKAQSAIVADLRTQLSEKSDRVVTVEAELSKTTETLTAALQSINDHMANERRDHSEANARLEAKISALEEKLTESSLQTRTLYEQLEQLKVERAEIYTQLNVKLETEVRLERDKAALENRLRLEEEEKKTFESSFRQAAARMEELKAREDDALVQIDELRRCGTELKSLLDQKKAALEKIQLVVTEMEGEKNDIKKNYIVVCEQKDRITELNTELQESVNTLKNKVTTLEGDIAEKVKQISVHTAEALELRDALAKEAEDKSFMQETLNETTCTLSSKEKRIVELSEIVSTLTSELESTRDNLATKDGTLQIVEVRLEEVSRALKDSSEALLACQDEKQTIQEDLDSARKALKSMEAEQAVREEQIKLELEGRQDKLDAADARIEQLVSEGRAATEELHLLREQLVDLTKSRDDAIHDHAVAAQALAATREELQTTAHKLEQASAVCAEASSLKEEIKELRAAIAQRDETETILKGQCKDKEDKLARLETELKSKELEISAKTSQVADSEAKIEALESSSQQLSNEIDRLNKSLIASENAREEALAENQQLTKDADANLEQIKEFIEEVQCAHKETERLTKENKALHLEQRRLAAELAQLQAKLNMASSGDTQQWKDFRRRLVDHLETVNFDAPILSDDELLAVAAKTVEASKRVKNLEAEKKTLMRLAENAEADVKGRISLLTGENDQLKRKLREATEQMNRSNDELRQVETALIKAKAGDAVDGGVICVLAREVMNLAVSLQEQRTSKEEVTQLRVDLAECNQDRDRLKKELKAMESFRSEVADLRRQKFELMSEITALRQEQDENAHDHTIDIMREGHDLELERLRNELNSAKAHFDMEIRRKDEYISTLLEKYDNAKQFSERKISDLHGVLHQNNISLQRPRRKSPNQTGLPLPPASLAGAAVGTASFASMSRPTEDELIQQLRDRDEEIRRLRLAKREVERQLCASTIEERSRFNASTSFTAMSATTTTMAARLGGSHANAEEGYEQRSRMPPPQLPPPMALAKERHSSADHRHWHEFREQRRLSAFSDSSSVKSVPLSGRPIVDGDPALNRSYSSRSLLADFYESSGGTGQQLQDRASNNSHRYSQIGRSHTYSAGLSEAALFSDQYSSATMARSGVRVSTQGSATWNRTYPSSTRLLSTEDIDSTDMNCPMSDKPLSTLTGVNISTSTMSSAFDNIGNELNYKCDLKAASAVPGAEGSARGGGRVNGLGGLGMGDDEEAQFMNPKNLEELENGAPPSPRDPSRGNELLQRNLQVPPHLRSSYPVETQNGKIPVTPLLKRTGQ